MCNTACPTTQHAEASVCLSCVFPARVQLKVVEKSGLNRDGTFLPPAIHPSFAKEPKYDMKTAMIEAEMVMGGVVADVLEKTGARAGRWVGLRICCRRAGSGLAARCVLACSSQAAATSSTPVLCCCLCVSP